MLRRLIFLSLLFFIPMLIGQEASFPLPQSVQEAQDALGIEGWTMIIVFVITFICLITEVRPPEIVMLFSTGILLLIGIITPNQFLFGFANPIIMTIAMLCIVVRAMEVNGLLEMIGRKVLTKSKIFPLRMLSLTAPVSIASAFLNNTPIVLLMTPLVRKWALKDKISPSKFLLPLSYAAIFGGACTLIGTSTNLVVHSLLKHAYPGLGFSMFELAYVGIPCVIVGLLYLTFFGKALIPDRPDPALTISEETREFTAEFVIGPECPLANRTIKDAALRYFRNELLIQIERNAMVIDSPSSEFVLFVGDRLIFIGDINQVAELHAIHDLQSQADPHFKLDVSSSHFSEVVIPTTSPLVGKTLKEIHFRNTYGASVVAIYRHGWRVLGNVRKIELQAGDTLMLLSGEALKESPSYRKDFYFIRHQEKLVVFHPLKAILVLLALITLITAVSFGANFLICSVGAAFVLMAFKCISIREAKNSVMWDILLLIACSFALGRAMETTGVAAYFAEIILSVVGTHPYMLIGGIVGVTIICTELMTNNAAALILFPIALTMAKLGGYDSPEAAKAVAVAVAIGASCAYAIPTGYQTHMIVYGPGGYRFTDFLKIGIPMDLMIWAIATFLIPKIWVF